MGRIISRAGERFHGRIIEMNIYNVDSELFIVTGRLTDARCRDSISFTGETKNKGSLHDLEIHLLVAKKGLVIEDIETMIHTVPRPDCWTMDKSLDPVIGLAVKKGFSREVKNLIGGKKGCTHLIHLLNAMSSALVQGYWAIMDIETEDIEAKILRAKTTASFIKDTCYTWREEGVSYKHLKQQFSVSPIIKNM